VTPRRCSPPAGRYLENRTAVRVRFQEIDTLQIVWHGHYLSYFEDARVAFGRRYGINYDDIGAAGLAAPIVKLSCDFFSPARFDDELEVVARLYERESAKIEFYYEVYRRGEPEPIAAGSTIQVFADANGDMLLTMPQFMREFYDKWERAMAVEHA
jgi:acyl-CoA thioester hydrolase